MIHLEVFFDYICPYCYRGHKMLLELLDKYSQIEVVWRPCEAHPRPEQWSIHSDLAIQGMYYVKEHGGNVGLYHRMVYEAYFVKGLDVSSPGVLASLAAECGVSTQDFEKAVSENRYEKQVAEGNHYAWEANRLDAVPSYRSGHLFIGSKDGILVSEGELNGFLEGLLEEEQHL